MRKYNDIRNKKEFIRYRIYVGGYRYDILTYHIAKFDIFDSIINEIDEDSFYRTLLTKENKLSADRFIDLLDHLVETMRRLFFNIDISLFAIEGILEKDKDLMNEYFHYNGAIGNELNKILYRIIIINFISNVKLIPCIGQLLDENKIQLKKYTEYSDKEIRSIIDLCAVLFFVIREKVGVCIYLNVVMICYKNI